jgi:hypothetical protein
MPQRMRLGLAGVILLSFLAASNGAEQRQAADESDVLWHFGTGG